jgi:phosphate transport system substrate-binding protein
VKKTTSCLICFLAVLLFNGCPAEEEDDIYPQLKIVEGFTFGNYPKVDGSTSTEPLNILIACKLLGIKHEWVQRSDRSWAIEPVLKKNSKRFQKLIKTSQTHGSIIDLIDKKADIILSARKMSPDEKAHSDAAGVSLIETPIALDAFIFIVHPDNPITSLTIEQIQDIYTGKITNWNEVGGSDAQIIPYIRNSNSGSQELMVSMVMKDLEFMEYLHDSYEYESKVIYSMVPVFEHVRYEIDSICYTVFYFKENQLKDISTKSIAIDGIYPNRENISSYVYPVVAEVYAAIRSDLDKSSTAYKLYELLQTEIGKEVITESGYLPN